MRWIWIPLMLAGCGRVGFGDGPGDAHKPLDGRSVDAQRPPHVL